MRRINTKTSEETVTRQNKKEEERRDRRKKDREKEEGDYQGETTKVGEERPEQTKVEGRKDHLDSAKAESNRSNQPDTEDNTMAKKPDHNPPKIKENERDAKPQSQEDYFAAVYHPYAASSDGIERRWQKVGKSEVLVVDRGALAQSRRKMMNSQS